MHPVLWAGWAALAAGAVLCVLGWYGISGERYAERQLPYLASCTVPGAALVVAGAVLLAQGRNALAAARVEELYALLVAAGPDDAERPGETAAAPVAIGTDLLMVPGGTLWHRADCPLVAGKQDALPVDSRLLAGGGLAPCPICEPDAPDGRTPSRDRPPAGPAPSADGAATLFPDGRTRAPGQVAPPDGRPAGQEGPPADPDGPPPPPAG
ncbi:hypothetical protein GCM10010515_17320 [Streptomyces fructofermentans]|uniref:Uncharacterized protein n=1 Tax=Streptomyces fructofermentans TaxID=152141 RepID=A0A918K5G7_9ACTN|nr:hypothetical protein GCM10010515_17320 [Streptomyces fructofermentans]